MKDLHFTQKGTGHPVILIHGFPMSGEIWEDEFTEVVAERFNVICIDLPGFGKSPLPAMPFTIDDIARNVLNWIEWKGFEKVIVIGHSLGGYITLSMAAQDPGRFAGFGLFHSTAIPDSEEKKQARDKAVEFVERNGAPAFTSNFILPLFISKEHPGIHRVKEIATRATAPVVTAYLKAMRNRPDRTPVIKKFDRPILFIAGDKDPGIPLENVLQQAALAKLPTVKILEGQAHMSMMENPLQAAVAVREFVSKCFTGKPV